MSKTNHFVTYIYSYEYNQKDKNAGFAKVDCRGEYIRLETQIRKKSMEREDVDICFLVKNENKLLAIPMGSIHFEREMGNFKGRFLVKDIGQTGYNFENVTGMYVKTQGEVFASQWLEEELNLSQIEIYKKQEEKKEEEKISPKPVVSKAAEVKKEENRDATIKATEAKELYDWRYEWEKLDQHSGNELVFGLALWTRNKGKS